MLDWIDDNQLLLWLLGAASIITFVASLIFIPAMVTRIRPDYFTHERRPPGMWAGRSPMVRVVIVTLKNVLGIVLIVAGVAMLALPGQGLLTIFAGFLLVDMPGKYRLERWLVARGPICRPINWLRRRAGREPLQTPAQGK